MYEILIAEGLKSISRLPMSTGWSSLPVTVATVLYSYEAVTVVSTPALNVSFLNAKPQIGSLFPSHPNSA